MCSQISENLKTVEAKILQSCEKSNRPRGSVKVLAVSKKQSMNTIREAYSSGIKSFGENYVQEFLQKKQELEGLEIHWEFIGKLQSKKVKDVVGQAELIHSVDRIKILNEIEKQCEIKKLQQKILLEINIANEPSKAGFVLSELPDAIEALKGLSRVIPCGLMIMPPLGIDENQLRLYFKQAAKLLEQLKNETKWEFFNELSMGTSGDFQLAIEEGATTVRLGTILLGERI